jgi:hypothetical protein
MPVKTPLVQACSEPLPGTRAQASRKALLALAAAAIALVALTGSAQAKTLTVCKSGCAYNRIQKAVDASGKGDTVAVKAGTYKEGVIVSGHKHDKLTIKGSSNNPSKTRLIQSGLHGAPAQNAIAVSGADNVRLTGFFARDFKANGFYVEQANGYKLDHLTAERDGEYGLFAYDSLGGSMTDSTAYYFNDSGFYVGETPPQRHPKRTTISNVTAYLNVLGFSGTNSKYVDIKNSTWFNNGEGITPNSLDSEKFPPDAMNRIYNNKIYWNNFNYYDGAPFLKRKTVLSSTDIPYPVGVGILLHGGRANQVFGNQIYGNWLAGFAMLDAFQLKNPAQRPLINNVISSNVFGLGGTDLNGRDLAYDGGGSGNCFANNTGVTAVFPTDGSTIVPCSTPPTPNVFSQAARDTAIGWVTDATHEAGWIPHPHAPQPGQTPIEHWPPS